MPIYKFSLTLRNALAQSIIDACDAGSGACKLNFRSRSVGTWAGGRTYAVGDSVYANGKNYDCTTAGTSAGTAPTWPTSGTVTDGTAVWTEGGDAGRTRCSEHLPQATRQRRKPTASSLSPRSPKTLRRTQAAKRGG